MTDEQHRSLEELREAYQELEPIERSGQLEDEDALTQATIRFLQTAWSNLPVPEARPPLRLRSRLFRILTTAPAQAAAAILFVGVTIFTYLLSTGSADAPTHTNQVALIGNPQVPNSLPSSNGARGIPLRNASFGPNASPRSPQSPHSIGGEPARLNIHIHLTRLQLAGAPFLSDLTPATSAAETDGSGETGEALANRARPEDLLRGALVSNREGDWSRAIELAARVLRMPKATREQRCRALYHLAHAQQALGQQDLSKQSSCRLEEELM